MKNNQKSLLIDDSYNANPDSMYASLSNLYKTKSKLHNYKTVLIIGDMLELGKKSMIKHLELIPIIKKINPEVRTLAFRISALFSFWNKIYAEAGFLGGLLPVPRSLIFYIAL